MSLNRDIKEPGLSFYSVSSPHTPFFLLSPGPGTLREGGGASTISISLTLGGRRGRGTGQVKKERERGEKVSLSIICACLPILIVIGVWRSVHINWNEGLDTYGCNIIRQDVALIIRYAI